MRGRRLRTHARLLARPRRGSNHRASRGGATGVTCSGTDVHSGAGVPACSFPSTGWKPVPHNTGATQYRRHTSIAVQDHEIHSGCAFLSRAPRSTGHALTGEARGLRCAPSRRLGCLRGAPRPSEPARRIDRLATPSSCAAIESRNRASRVPVARDRPLRIAARRKQRSLVIENTHHVRSSRIRT